MQLRHAYRLIITISVFLFALLVLINSLTPNGSTPILQHLATEASYVIWKDGGTYYAKNGFTGEVEYAGTNASEIFQSSIDATCCKGGGLIFAKAGNYLLKTPILMQSYVALEGEGWGEQSAATILTLEDGVNDDVIKTSQQKNYHITIKNLRIDANKDGQTSGTGIHFYATDRPIIENVMIRYAKDKGVHVEGYGSEVSIQPLIRSIYIYGCDEEGLFIAATDSHVSDVDVGGCNLSALRIYWAHNSLITLSSFWGSKYGVYLDQSNQCSLTSCRIDYNVNDGIYVSSSFDCIIDGNEVYHNSQAGSGTCDGIYLVGNGNQKTEHNIISNNYVGEEKGSSTTYHRYAINEDGSYCDYNLIVGNDLTHCTYGEKMRVTGTHTVVEHNMGFLTKNCGNVTISSSTSVTVNHGLAGTPTTIIVTPQSDIDGDFWISDVGSSTLQINVDISQTVSFYWHTEYKP